MKNIKLDLFAYSDYRLFLNDYVSAKKKNLGKYTIGQFAKALDLKDTSSINKVLKGQRTPGGELQEKLCRYFKFNNKEYRYFVDLVSLAKSRPQSEEYGYIYERLCKLNPSSGFLDLRQEQFNLISNWYYFAIRELVKLKNFRYDVEWIQNQLVEKISLTDIQKAIDTLIKLELLHFDEESSKLTISTPRFRSSNDTPSEAIKRYHEGCLEQAKLAVRRHQVDVRHIIGSTLAIKKSNIARAKNLIDEFLDSFSKIIEDHGEGSEEVYQMNIQFYPLTHSKNQEV